MYNIMVWGGRGGEVKGRGMRALEPQNLKCGSVIASGI